MFGRSFPALRLVVIAADRPFLDAGEVVVGTVSVLPHREHERQIGLLLILKSHDELFEFGKRLLGVKIRIALLEVDVYGVAGWRAAFERHIGEFCDGPASRNVAKAAAAQNGTFERELR